MALMREELDTITKDCTITPVLSEGLSDNCLFFSLSFSLFFQRVYIHIEFVTIYECRKKLVWRLDFSLASERAYIKRRIKFNVIFTRRLTKIKIVSKVIRSSVGTFTLMCSSSLRVNYDIQPTQARACV